MAALCDGDWQGSRTDVGIGEDLGQRGPEHQRDVNVDEEGLEGRRQGQFDRAQSDEDGEAEKDFLGLDPGDSECP